MLIILLLLCHCAVANTPIVVLFLPCKSNYYIINLMFNLQNRPDFERAVCSNFVLYLSAVRRTTAMRHARMTSLAYQVLLAVSFTDGRQVSFSL